MLLDSKNHLHFVLWCGSQYRTGDRKVMFGRYLYRPRHIRWKLHVECMVRYFYLESLYNTARALPRVHGRWTTSTTRTTRRCELRRTRSVSWRSGWSSRRSCGGLGFYCHARTPDSSPTTGAGCVPPLGPLLSHVEIPIYRGGHSRRQTCLVPPNPYDFYFVTREFFTFSCCFS